MRRSLAGISEADRRILAKTDAALSIRGALLAEPAIAIGVIEVCSSAEPTLLPMRPRRSC